MTCYQAFAKLDGQRLEYGKTYSDINKNEEGGKDKKHK